MDDGYTSGRKAMPHVMALNKNPTMGLKNDRQPKPGVSKVVAFAKGGAVKKHSDARQDKKMVKSMVKKSCIKPVNKACGGKVAKKK